MIGKQCDQCKPEHYGLNSGKGCAECDCDTDGTLNETRQCDVVSYTISSTIGIFFNLKIMLFKIVHWSMSMLDIKRVVVHVTNVAMDIGGDPTVNCHRCECSGIGSVSDQCNKLTGACECRKGIAGYHCGSFVIVGTYGQIPFCSQCGECFDDWTKIMKDVQGKHKDGHEKAALYEQITIFAVFF